MKKKILPVFAVVTLICSVLFLQSALAATYTISSGQKITYNQSNSTYNNYYSVNIAKIQPGNSSAGSSGNTVTPAVPASPSSGYVTVGKTKVNYGNTSNQNTNYYPVVINKNPDRFDFERAYHNSRRPLVSRNESAHRHGEQSS